MMNGKTTTVHILTYCRKPELFYGTELVFKTLRVGFPTARVVVTDNASVLDVRPEIKEHASSQGCEFRQLETEIQHDEFIQSTLYKAADGARNDVAKSLVFLDPDICLWKNCEGFAFEGLLAGRVIAAYNDAPRKCVMMPRLHTSFMWIPDPKRLVDEIRRIKAEHFDFNPFRSFSVMMGKVWVRYDTGASLFAAVADNITPFNNGHLEYYDHIFCGSHFDLLADSYTEGGLEVMRRIHEDAKAGRLNELKGVWKIIDALWRQEYKPVE